MPTDDQIRQWAGPFFGLFPGCQDESGFLSYSVLRREFVPSAQMCADHFGISFEDAATAILKNLRRHKAMAAMTCEFGHENSIAQLAWDKWSECLVCKYPKRGERIEAAIGAAKMRDGYKCQACGRDRSTVRIDGSHCLERNVSYSGYVPWDIDLIVTLCAIHHAQYSTRKKLRDKIDWLAQFGGTKKYADRLRQWL